MVIKLPLQNGLTLLLNKLIITTSSHDHHRHQEAALYKNYKRYERFGSHAAYENLIVHT